MGKHNYTTHMDGARAVGRDLPISTKHSVEVCRCIRGKSIKRAKKILQDVIMLKSPIPYRRYNRDVGHKAGMASGRFPKKTSQEILKIVESAEVNAQFKGMDTSELVVAHSVAHKASRPFHAGRQRGRYMKRTHIEIVVREMKKKDDKQKDSDPVQETGKNTEQKESQENKMITKEIQPTPTKQEEAGDTQ
jgi:large subunit ribosomal protein L22